MSTEDRSDNRPRLESLPAAKTKGLVNGVEDRKTLFRQSFSVSDLRHKPELEAQYEEATHMEVADVAVGILREEGFGGHEHDGERLSMDAAANKDTRYHRIKAERAAQAALHLQEPPSQSEENGRVRSASSSEGVGNNVAALSPVQEELKKPCHKPNPNLDHNLDPNLDLDHPSRRVSSRLLLVPLVSS